MNFIRDKMVMKKINPTNVSDSTINKGLIHVFSQEVLIPNKGEILETYSLLGQPLLLVYMEGKRTMVALNAMYDTPKHAEDRDMEKYYYEEIKQIAAVNKSQPFISHFKVDSKVHKMGLTDEECRTCILFKGVVPVK